jgi:hypothetical protein
MGKLWRADKALENSEGLRWVRERLAAHDWAKVDWITVRRGHSEAYAFRGVCKYPRKEHSGYRINCNVSKHAQHSTRSPTTCASLPCTATLTELGQGHLKAISSVSVTLLPAMARASNGNGCTGPWS